MKRRLFTLTLFALVALVAVVAALGANAQPRVTEATGTGFPARSYILTLPHGMQLKPGSVHVFENGRPVPDLTVTPAEESTSRQFGAVLVVDASTSMEGEPERAAFSAARVFAAQRKGHEQLALVTYNITPTVVLPFTTEQARIDAALSKQPPFLFGTHIYDAITHSLDLLQTGTHQRGNDRRPFGRTGACGAQRHGCPRDAGNRGGGSACSARPRLRSRAQIAGVEARALSGNSPVTPADAMSRRRRSVSSAGFTRSSGQASRASTSCGTGPLQARTSTSRSPSASTA